MNVLIIGGGGREHAIAKEVSKSDQCNALYAAPGNPGISELGICVDLGVEDIDGLVAFAEAKDIDFTIVGPEIPLCAGIVDAFEAKDLLIFGPSEAAARLEGSKAFSKDVMKKYAVPTAAYKKFTELDKAVGYIKAMGAPIVVKASGLAAGKGAIVCMTEQEALDAVTDMLGEKAVFGDSGKEVVIEEFMTGEEASIFAICNGTDYVVLSTAQDHKRIFDNDEGPNTGGMGAYSPAPIVTEELLAEVKETIIEPTLYGMVTEGCPYVGVLYVGIMVTPQGPKVVEYNVRFGDPEAQVILPLYDGDLLELLHAVTCGNVSDIEVKENKGSAAVIVLASGGYPGGYEKGKVIQGLDLVRDETMYCIHAGTKQVGDDIVSAGGRVLGMMGKGDTLKEAIDRAYEGASKVSFDDVFYRKDIGQKGLKRIQGV
ncbi:MAG: phosphoribosylamine--glycine ligase [Fibrobacterales bacterium]